MTVNFYNRPEQMSTLGIITDNNLPPVPIYYPLEKSSRFVTDASASVIAARISDCLRIMSVQAEYDNEMSTALLYTSEHVEIHLALWQGTGPRYPACVIVEAQRRKGDALTFHKYCRNILDASQGEFDSMKFHTKEKADKRYCNLAEQMLHKKRGESEIDNSLLAIEIAASLLKKDRMDARLLGMESLCLLTDPTRTGLDTAILASRVILTGSFNDTNVDDEEFMPDELGVREAIMSLVLFGQLCEGGNYDSIEDDSNEHPDEKRHNLLLHNLALSVLANALAVLEGNGNGVTPVQSKEAVTDTLLSDSQDICRRDLLRALFNSLDQSNEKPHDATLSANCLKFLFKESEKARRRAPDLNAKQILATALDVGRRTHLKLQKAATDVIHELQEQSEE